MLGKGKVMKVLSILGVFLLAVAIGSYALTPQLANAEGEVGAGNMCGNMCNGTRVRDCSIFPGCSGDPFYSCIALQGDGVCLGGELPCDGPAYCWERNSRYCWGY